ncbi:hypothetical protein BJ912DRAFT_1045822 [Pholiota molesta]|nr:hypothetical protein BJ912DRAFT_1045822 [Pholiota molesta]
MSFVPEWFCQFPGQSSPSVSESSKSLSNLFLLQTPRKHPLHVSQCRRTLSLDVGDPQRKYQPNKTCAATYIHYLRLRRCHPTGVPCGRAGLLIPLSSLGDISSNLGFVRSQHKAIHVFNNVLISIPVLLLTFQLVTALPRPLANDFLDTNDLVSRAQGPSSCSLLDLDDAESLPGWSKLEQYARSTWGEGEWTVTINPPGYRDKPATMCVTGFSKIIEAGLPGDPNCTETRVGIQPEKKDGTTIKVDEGFTNVTTAAHAEFFEAHFLLPNITKLHLNSMKAVGAFINAPDNSFVTTATNVTIKSAEITPVPDKHCIGTIHNSQCIIPAHGRIQLVASGYIWFNYKTKRAPLAKPKGAKHSRYTVKIEDVLKNATDRSAWIDYQGYMNTSMRYDYYDECRWANNL